MRTTLSLLEEYAYVASDRPAGKEKQTPSLCSASMNREKRPMDGLAVGACPYEEWDGPLAYPGRTRSYGTSARQALVAG